MPRTPAARVSRAGRAVLPVLLMLPALVGASPRDGAARRDVTVDPALAGRLAAGPAPVMVTWRDEADGRVLLPYLERRGLEMRRVADFNVAMGCASGLTDLRLLTRAPGAWGVWGNEPMETATDKSVPTAFNGPPSQVWQGMGVTGKGITIAVVDTGLDARHPDLEVGRRTVANVRMTTGHRDTLGPQDSCVVDTSTETVRGGVRDILGVEAPLIPDTETTSGHGTHIAGVAAGDGAALAGTYRGMAPEARLIGVAVTDTFHVYQPVDDPTSQATLAPSTLNAVAGLGWLSERYAHPVLGARVALLGWVQDGVYEPSHPLAEAFAGLDGANITVVVPAGNGGGAMSDCSVAESCHINRWAGSPYVIAVAATETRTSRTKLAEYSSGGDPRTWTLGQGAGAQTVRHRPVVTAPGTDVTATRRIGLASYYRPEGSVLAVESNPKNLRAKARAEYAPMTGTSIAAGHVAGTVALMQQAAVEAKGCYLTAQQVREALRQSATPMPGYAEWQVGAGMLDATQAVALARIFPRVAYPEYSHCPSLAQP